MPGYLAYQNIDLSKPVYKEVCSLKGERLVVLLEDGTRVWLNADSKLVYPEQFAKDKREVSLVGEAYFEVKKDISKPFMVQADEMNIRVTGTSFNVSGYPTDSVVTTTLDEGGIVISYPYAEKSGTYQMAPGQTAIYEKGSRLCKVMKNEYYKDASVWKENKLIFRNTNAMAQAHLQTVQTFRLSLRPILCAKLSYTPNLSKPVYKEVCSLKGERLVVLLEDGTRVWLNADSKLVYPEQFAKDKREVSLVGEAYFEVKKDISKPFMVQADEMNIRVTGTSFNVSGYPTDSVVTTTLDEGGIVISYPYAEKSGTYQMAPGQTAIYEKGSRLCKVMKNEYYKDASVWKENKLIFRNTNAMAQAHLQTVQTFRLSLRPILCAKLSYTPNLSKSGTSHPPIGKDSAFNSRFISLSICPDIWLIRISIYRSLSIKRFVL